MKTEIDRDPLTGDYIVSVERAEHRPGLPASVVFVFTPDEFKAFAEQISAELFDLTA